MMQKGSYRASATLSASSHCSQSWAVDDAVLLVPL